MKLNNKGHWHFCIPIIVKGATAWPIIQSVYVGIAGVLITACVWHIPAWEKAKDAGGDAPAIYQAQQMWPQQVFHSIPNTSVTFLKGNGGNFPGGVDK